MQKLGLNSLGKYRRKWLVQDAPFRTVPHRSARRIMNYDMTRYHKVSQYMREDKILYYINLYHILSYTISDAIF